MGILEFVFSNNEYLQDLITRSTYHSNAIEGSTLTYAETYAILYNDNSFKIEGKEPREIYEAINHKKALELVFSNLKNDNGFDERFIKNLNETINKDIKDTEGYRSVQVFIQGSEHIPPEPEKIPNLMMYFVYNYNHDEQDIFTKIARYHIEFEKIHPFVKKQLEKITTKIPHKVQICLLILFLAIIIIDFMMSITRYSIALY